MSDQAQIDEQSFLPVETVAGRWGDAAKAGFMAVPNALMRAQAKLGLSPTDMVVLLNILLHWWESERLPFPSTGAIAKRAGLSARTVQRSLQELESKGLISRLRGRPILIGTQYKQQRARYDLSGLRERLGTIARSDVWYRPDVVRHAPAGTRAKDQDGSPKPGT